jgi:integrase
LLLLPEQLVEKSQVAGPKPRSAALLLQTAAAVETLLYCPMRIANLASLRIDQHLRWATKDRELVLYITIPGDEVKNGTPLHFELTGGSADIVRDYLDRGRLLLSDQPGQALFPKLNGDSKLPGDLSQQIKRIIFKETGLVVNPHLFRSLAGKIHNLVAAGDFATISHVLSDRIETVMKSYVPFEQQASLRHYQASVNEVRRRSSLSGHPDTRNAAL